MRTLSPLDHPSDFFRMVPTDVALMTPSSLEPDFPIGISGLCILRFSCPRHNELATRAGPSGIGVGGDGGRAVQGSSAREAARGHPAVAGVWIRARKSLSSY